MENRNRELEEKLSDAKEKERGIEKVIKPQASALLKLRLDGRHLTETAGTVSACDRILAMKVASDNESVKE